MKKSNLYAISMIWVLLTNCANVVNYATVSTTAKGDIEQKTNKIIVPVHIDDVEPFLQNITETSKVHTLKITAPSPNLQAISEALINNNSIKIDLDLSDCSELTSIEDSAFYQCKNLENITLPENLNNIEADAFCCCENLKNITLPKNLTTISDGVFNKCTSLENITLPENLNSIGSDAFAGCSTLENITLPENLTTIGDGAFYECTGFTNITIPTSVTAIGSWAFMYCDSLTDVIFEDSNSTWLAEYITFEELEEPEKLDENIAVDNSSLNAINLKENYVDYTWTKQ